LEISLARHKIGGQLGHTQALKALRPVTASPATLQTKSFSDEWQKDLPYNPTSKYRTMLLHISALAIFCILVMRKSKHDDTIVTLLTNAASQ
jgi:hypothetical protein